MTITNADALLQEAQVQGAAQVLRARQLLQEVDSATATSICHFRGLTPTAAIST